MKIKKGTGRPCIEKEKLRYKTIGVRVNQNEWDNLQQKADYLGICPATLLRDFALKKRLPPPPVPELNRKSYANLMHLASNINQLTRSINQGQKTLSVQYMALFKTLLTEICITQELLLGLYKAEKENIEQKEEE